MKPGIFVIKKEKFSKTEALVWQQEVKKSVFLLGYCLEELLSFENVFKVYCGSDFVGSAFNIDFCDKWTELSGFIIKENYRGQGLGGQLLKLLIADAFDRNKNIYIVSRNQIMKKSMTKYDFKTTTVFFRLPREIQLYTIKSLFSKYRITQGLKKGFLAGSGQPFFAYRTTKPRSGNCC